MLRVKVTDAPALLPNQRFARIAFFNEDGTPFDILNTGQDLNLSDYTGDVNITGDLTASGQVAGSTATADVVKAGDGGIKFGSAEDTDLYRTSAQQLETQALSLTGNGLSFTDGGGPGTPVSYLYGLYDGGLAIDGAGAYLFKSDGIHFGWSNDTALARDAAGSLALNGDKLATRPWTTAQIDALIGGAPGTRDTLKEISDQLNADESATAAIIASLTSYETAAHASSTYATQAALASYLTTAAAASTYETSVHAAATYDTIATAAGYAKTDGSRAFTGNESFGAGIKLTSDAATAAVGLQFGSANDANLYRVGGSQLKTDGAFILGAGELTVRQAGAGQVKLGAVGPSSVAGAVFGSASDTNLYRSAADTLKTDDAFLSAVDITARAGALQQVQIGLRTVIGTDYPAIIFGSAQDVYLYRNASSSLRTEGDFIAGGFNRANNNMVAKYGAAQEMAIGIAGPTSEAGLKFGSAADTNLYRSAASTLKTDGGLVVQGSIQGTATSHALPVLKASAGGNIILTLSDGAGTIGHTIQSPFNTLTNVLAAIKGPTTAVGVQTGDLYRFFRQSDDANPVLAIGADGKHSWGAGGASAVDAVFGRLAASLVGGDSATLLAAKYGSADQVRIGSGGKIEFGSSIDTNLYRSGAGVLKTDGQFVPNGALLGNNDLTARNGAASQINIGARGPASEAGFTFGSAADTNLYRSAADTLKTDDSLVVGSHFSAENGAVSTGNGSALTVGIGFNVNSVVAFTNPSWNVAANMFSVQGYDATQTGDLTQWKKYANRGPVHSVGVDGKLQWGPDGATDGRDTNLYRAAAGVLKTDGNLYAVGSLVGNQGGAAQVVLSSGLPGGAAGMTFGSASDTNLYRSAANTLKTDGSIIAVNELTAYTGNAAKVRMTTVSSQASILFGSAGDTNFYRSAAGALQTDGSLVAAAGVGAPNAQTASYTAVLADAGKAVEVNNASANTFTVPPNSSVAFPIGAEIEVRQTGAGQTTITAGAGVTINSRGGLMAIAGQWGSATLVKRATDTWLLVGDLA